MVGVLQIIRFALVCIAAVIALLMLLLAMPGLQHHNMRYARAVRAHHDAPNEATARQLAEVTAADDRVRLALEFGLAMLLLVLVLGVSRTTKAIRCRNI